MAASDDLTLRIRSRGGRAAARDVDDTRKSVDKFGRSSRSSAKHATLLGKATHGLFKPFHHLRDEAFGLAKGVAAAGLAFGSVEGIKRSIETTDTLVKNTVKLHNQFGLTEEAASGLAGVLQARDLSPEGLQMGLTQLARQLRDAEHGSKNAQGAFRIFGMSARDVHVALGSRDGLSNTFTTVVDQLSDMPGGARKAALSQQLLGRAARGLSPLLQEGALGLKQQLRWAKEFGVTLDEHTVGSVEDMAAAQTEAQYAMLGLQIQLGRFAAPAVAKANVALADIIRSFREGRPEGHQFSRTVYQLGVDLEPVGRGLLAVGGFLKDHPRLLRIAALGYLAYRTKVLKLISFGPLAYGKGLIAGRAYSLGFERGALTGAGRQRFLGVGRGIGRIIGPAAAVIIASEIAQALGSENADPLLFLHPPAAGGKHDTIPRNKRGTGNINNAVAYFRKHPRELTPAVVNSMSQGQRNALGVHTVPNATGGEIVIHNTVKLDGKEIAKSVHRQAVKRKATG
jgi:hypothetical protein